MNHLENYKTQKVPRNSVFFGKWLESVGKSYKDVYDYLNNNGITKYNDILSESGVLKETEYEGSVGSRFKHSCDVRTPEQTTLDCNIGNIQEELFCIDNPDFKPNNNATHKGVMNDNQITTRKLDLIHIPTNTEVEFKVCYYHTLKDNYKNVIYSHRDGHFTDFMNSGKIIIIYFPYYNSAVIFDKSRYRESGGTGAVKMLAENELSETTGKYVDKILIFKGLFKKYIMLEKMNSKYISGEVKNIVDKRSEGK